MVPPPPAGEVATPGLIRGAGVGHKGQRSNTPPPCVAWSPPPLGGGGASRSALLGGGERGEVRRRFERQSGMAGQPLAFFPHRERLFLHRRQNLADLAFVEI